MPENAVYVGRPTRWGNDLRPDMLDVHDRPLGVERAIELYRLATLRFVEDGEPDDVKRWLAPLRGHDLACWCPLDQRCHADVLLALLNEATTKLPAARPRAGPRAAVPGGGIGARRRATHTRGQGQMSATTDLYLTDRASFRWGVAETTEGRDCALEVHNGDSTIVVHLAWASQAAQLIEAATELHRRLLRAEAVGAR